MQADNRPILDADELLEGIRGWVEIESPTGDAAGKGGEAFGGDDDAPPVGQVVIVAHLAVVMVGQFGDRRVVEDEIGTREEEGGINHSV